MKKALLVLLIAGLFSGGVCNAAVTSAQLAKMAQKSSKTPLDALCLAVYEAVKADESKAVDIFKSVMSQRDTWTATETYAILRSILLASPALEQGFVQNAKWHRVGLVALLLVRLWVTVLLLIPWRHLYRMLLPRRPKLLPITNCIA